MHSPNRCAKRSHLSRAAPAPQRTEDRARPKKPAQHVEMTSQSEPANANGAASNAVLEATSFLFGSNAAFIEALYRQYLDNPDAVDPELARLLRRARRAGAGRHPARPRPGLEARRQGPAGERRAGRRPDRPGAAQGQWRGRPSRTCAPRPRNPIRAIQLVRAYRVIGHLAADLDPLGLAEKQNLPQLEPSFYGFHEADLDKPIYMDGVLGLADRHAAPGGRHPQAHLLRAHRLRVHAHQRSGAEGLAAAPDRRPGQGDHLHRSRARRRSSTS